jgi:predicted DNA-binding transcriptional regulator AlpA
LTVTALRRLVAALERRVSALEQVAVRKAARAEDVDRGDRFVSFRELRSRLGHPSRQQVYRRMKAGQLPQPTKPFGGKLYWSERDIDAVIAGTWREPQR